MAPAQNAPSNRRKRQRPATTAEEREHQMVSLAYEQAQRQMEDGTASAMVLTHFLKLGTARARLEEEKLRKENTLLEAKASNLNAQTSREDIYEKALKAMRSYQGFESNEDYEE